MTVKMSILPGGCRLITEAMQSMESVALGVWADAGSADEAPHEFGQAHFLEHMLFKGTERHSAFSLAEAIEDVGGQINAFTERESTHLYSRVLAEHLPVAISLLGDMICHSLFPDEEVQRERQVILEEISKYESLPEERIHDLIMEGLWHGGALGHPILGTEASVTALSREQLVACWRRHFSADRVLITAAGKLVHEEVAVMVEEAFADLPPAGIAWPQFSQGTQLSDILLTKDEEQINFCWGGRAFSASDERIFALAMIDAILGASTTSRLFQEVREKRGLAYDVASYSMGFRETGLLCATAAMSPETFAQVLALTHEQIVALRRDGISAKELARAKEQMKAGLALSSEGTADQMRLLATHYLTWGEVYPITYLIERMNRVTLDEVWEVADQVLDIADWTFTAIGPIDHAVVRSFVPSR